MNGNSPNPPTTPTSRLGGPALALAAGALLSLGAQAQVDSILRLEPGMGGFTGNTIGLFGSDIDVLGDVDGNGVPDLIIGDGGVFGFAEIAWVLLMDDDGSVLSERSNEGDGVRVSGIGDLDDDGVVDAVVAESGSVTILFLNSDGTERSRATISPSAVGGTGSFGDGVSALGDFDGDGVEDLVVGDRGDSSGRGAVYLVFLNTDGTVKGSAKIGEGAGGFSGGLGINQGFGIDVDAGDIDGDGVVDLIVGAGSLGSVTGKAYVVLLNSDGTVKSDQEISTGVGGFMGPVTGSFAGAEFGERVAFVGDATEDGLPDVLIGQRFADDSVASNTGTAWLLSLNADGTVATEIRLTPTENVPPGSVDDSASGNFGLGVAGIGDFDGNGVPDMAIGQSSIPGTVYIALNGAPLPPATAAIRNGAGTNPICAFPLNEPMLGEDWNVGILTSAHPDATMSLLAVFNLPLSGIFVNAGEVLVFGTPFFSTNVPATGFLDTHTIPVANDPILLGFPLYCQGVIFEPGSAVLTNAIDIVINR